MQCFDCATVSTKADAVAVCAGCGAGACLEHTLTGHQVEPVASVGNPATRRLPGRRVFCAACADAYVADDAAASRSFAAHVDAALAHPR